KDGQQSTPPHHHVDGCSPLQQQIEHAPVPLPDSADGRSAVLVVASSGLSPLELRRPDKSPPSDHRPVLQKSACVWILFCFAGALPGRWPNSIGCAGRTAAGSATAAAPPSAPPRLVQDQETKSP